MHSDFGRARLAPCPSILSCVICFAAARLTASPKMQITISPTVPRAQRHKWQAEGWRAQRAGPRVWAAYGLKPSPDPTGIVSEDDLLCHVCAVTALRSPQNSPGAATALLQSSGARSIPVRDAAWLNESVVDYLLLAPSDEASRHESRDDGVAQTRGLPATRPVASTTSDIQHGLATEKCAYIPFTDVAHWSSARSQAATVLATRSGDDEARSECHVETDKTWGDAPGMIDNVPSLYHDELATFKTRKAFDSASVQTRTTLFRSLPTGNEEKESHGDGPGEVRVQVPGLQPSARAFGSEPAKSNSLVSLLAPSCDHAGDVHGNRSFVRPSSLGCASSQDLQPRGNFCDRTSSGHVASPGACPCLPPRLGPLERRPLLMPDSAHVCADLGLGASVFPCLMRVDP